MTLQRTHSTTPLSSQNSEIIIICDGMESPANVGSLFRISDAMGVKEIIFCNASVNFDSPRLQKTARNTHKIVSFSVSDSIHSEIEKLKTLDYKILALEITTNSIPLQKLSWKHPKTVLVIGNENTGVSKEVLEQIPIATHIEMHGNNSSMNVIQATSIALFALTKN